MGVRPTRQRDFVDVDLAVMAVVAYPNGDVLFDTDPDSPGVDSMVQLTRAQVEELIQFLQADG